MTELAPVLSTLPAELLAILRCPDCGEPFEFTGSAAPSVTGGVFGVLSCGPHQYPVIDGIPVIRHDRVRVQDHVNGRDEVAGPTVEELLATVRGPEPVTALIDLLAFPPALPWGLERLPGLRLPFTRGPGRRAAIQARRQQVRRLLAQPVERQTADDWMRL